MEHDLSGRVLGGRFELLSPLGEGGYGAVYLARQTTMGRKVAVKVINPKVAETEDFVERFEREARVASRLQHPNTVVYFDFGQDGDIHFLAMEYVEGRTLSHEIERSGPMSLARTAHLADQICGALAEAHGLGMVHRDLKPANILLTERGGDPDFVKVIDFGLAKIVQGDSDVSRRDLTIDGVILGTPAYMAPEQVRGRPVDSRCDIYSLGVILFVMLTGQKPYDGDTPLGTAVMHITEEIPLVRSLNPGVPQAMEDLVCWCMAKDPDERPPHVEAVADALDDVLLEHGGLSPTGRRRRMEARGAQGPSTATLDPTPPTRSSKRVGARLAGGAERAAASARPPRSGGGVSRTLLIGLLAAFALAAGTTVYLLSQHGGGETAAGQPSATEGLAEDGSGDLAAVEGEGSAAAPPVAEGVALAPEAELELADQTPDAAVPDAAQALERAMEQARSRLGVDFLEARVAALEAGAAASPPEAHEPDVAPPEGSEVAPRRAEEPETPPRTGAQEGRHHHEPRDTRPATGHLRITAIPYGRVYCDSHSYGPTPIDEEVPVGRYECRIVSPQGQEELREIAVEPGAGELVQVRFER